MLLDESMKRLENRANEILGKIGRMDRMLDAVVEGSSDCPRLFILTPAAGGPTASMMHVCHKSDNRFPLQDLDISVQIRFLSFQAQIGS